MATLPRRLLLRGGRVLTPDHPAATAVAISRGRVVWVGPESDATAWEPDADAVVDLGGALLAPGFVDAHAHLARTGNALRTVDLRGAASRTDALDRLAAAARADDAPARAGGVLLAHGWDDTGWPEGGPFTSAELTAAVGERAVYASRVDAHSAVVSSPLVALDLAILTAPGWLGDGLVERDAHRAALAVVERMQTRDDRLAALRAALAACATRGVTSVHDLNAPHISAFDDRDLIAEIAAEQAVPEVVSYWGAALGGEHADCPRVAGFAGDLCVDGSLGSRTAALTSPYADGVATDAAGAPLGQLYLDAAGVRDHLVWCTERGVQGGFHAIGDRALDVFEEGLVLAAEKVGEAAVVAARHRVEHAEMPTPSLIATMARLGLVASVQPAFDAEWGGPRGMYERRVGPARAATMNPFATMVRAGLTLAFGSDSPVTPVDPWAGVRAAVHHHNADEGLLPRTAFDAHTRGGHRARGDDEAGTLTPGAAATFAVWDVTAQAPTTSASTASDALEAVARTTSDSDATGPRCLLAVGAGVVLFDADALGPFATSGSSGAGT